MGTFKRIDSRFRKKLFALRWKKRALARRTTLGAPNLTPTTSFIKKLLLHPDFEKFSLQEQKEFVQKIPDFPKKFYQELEPSSEVDIKIPWEFSRFQKLFFCGCAYEQEKNPKIVEKFQQEIIEWIDKNPFLIGVNWVCPMEVAIRSINWIFAYHFFKESPVISEKFWKRFLSALYEHMFYLENNWETSDRPNNHYIADLVGYFYLCTLFGFEKKRETIVKEIIKQFFHQVQPDGTAYEGSTAYHRLDTELFLLFSMACDAEKISLQKEFHDRLAKMFTFLEYCAINEKDFLQVGDNDSGKIVLGLKNFFVKKTGVYHYPDFGITIAQKNDFHISFRHPTYKKHQPTGHFHRDELSVTLAYKGIPILVDPGSYLYTSDEMWRNAMRSPSAHNTFYKRELFSPKELFQLDKVEQDDTAEIYKEDEYLEIKNSFLGCSRKLTFDYKNNSIKIEDVVPEYEKYKWSFLFHPDVRVEKGGPKEWVIFHEKGNLLTFESSLELRKEDGFYSPAYGSIRECSKLVSQASSCLFSSILLITLNSSREEFFENF
jgi:hypothetical protein